jgi:hypothetical protein
MRRSVGSARVSRVSSCASTYIYYSAYIVHVRLLPDVLVLDSEKLYGPAELPRLACGLPCYEQARAGKPWPYTVSQTFPDPRLLFLNPSGKDVPEPALDLARSVSLLCSSNWCILPSQS